MRCAVLAVLAVVGVVGTGAVSYKAVEYRSAAIAAQETASKTITWQRETVRADAGLPRHSEVHPMTAARAVRDFIYRKTVVGSGSAYGNDGAEIYRNLGRDGSEQLCGGMATAYAWAMRSLDVPARIVQLAAASFLSGEVRADTHVTTEVFVDGRWLVSDPTFNGEFTCGPSRERLDIAGMRDCVNGGGELSFHPGETQIPERRLSDYYISYDRLLAAYTTARASIDGRTVEPEGYPSTTAIADAVEKYYRQP